MNGECSGNRLLMLYYRFIAVEKSKEIPSSVILKIVKRDPAFSIVSLPLQMLHIHANTNINSGSWNVVVGHKQTKNSGMCWPTDHSKLCWIFILLLLQWPIMSLLSYV